jgi:hypothetical protein
MTSDRNISLFQKILDAFHYARKWTVTAVVYLSLRLYGSEVSFESLWSRTFDSAKHTDLNLDEAKDLETLFGEAQGNLRRAEARRTVIMDKCKVLFTLSTILLGAIGLLMPKAFAFSHSWMKILFFFATLAFVIVIVLLVFFFGVGNDMKVALTQDQVDLEEKDLKKCLINVYLKCGIATENRTDFLVELYKVAQFFFLTAFTIIALLFMMNFLTQSPDVEMKNDLKRLRGDQRFIESIRGEKGEKGDAGAKGDKGPQGERGEKGDSGAPINLSQQDHTNRTPESAPK